MNNFPEVSIPNSDSKNFSTKNSSKTASASSFSFIKKSRPKKNTKKVILIISVSIVFLISIILLILFIFNNQQLKSNLNSIVCSEDFRDCLSKNSSPQEAIDSFQKLIDDEQNQEKKASLYSNRSEILFETYSQDPGYTNKIIDDALKADGLSPTSETAYRLYDFYNFYNDNEQANYYLNQCFIRQEQNQ